VFFLSGVPGLLLPDGSLQTSRPVQAVLVVQPGDYRHYLGLVEGHGGTCRRQGDFVYCPFILQPGH
jgi:hypothetical protein